MTVKDTTAPVITAPNMTVEATQSSGWKVGTFAATATDAVGPVTLSYSKSVGQVLPFGTTTVTVTATDGCGQPLLGDLHRARAGHDGAGVRARCPT